MLSRGRLSDRRCADSGPMSPACARAGTDKHDNVRIGNKCNPSGGAKLGKIRTRFFLNNRSRLQPRASAEPLTAEGQNVIVPIDVPHVTAVRVTD
jgi:hypothetical protein